MRLEDVRAIAITDCGSTTTKAILIERVDGVFRQTYRGDAPTTVEAPVEDVTRGVVAALEDLSVISGRRVVDEAGEIIRPASEHEGVDLYLSTSSAGGGLQMAVAGVVRRLSAESAERAALGAGAIVAGAIACDDEEPLHAQIDRLRRLRPDMVLLAGGTDGGASLPVLELVELLAAADPRPRFGEGFKLPVIYAGNRALREDVERALGQTCDVRLVDNVRPNVDGERIEPARDAIHEIFLDHVMRQAPGFGRLVDWTDAPVLPTPSAVGEILVDEAARRGGDVLCVDIGGATTDVFSVSRGRFTRTVSANMGLSYSATNVLAAAGSAGIARWLPFKTTPESLWDLVMNKTIRPTTIPDTVSDLLIEQAVAREALRLSFAHHLAFEKSAHTGPTEHNIDSAFTSAASEGLSLMDVGLIIGSGGVLSHAPRPAETAAMIIDSFLPEGVTTLAKDSVFMMPHLGALLGVMPEAARSVFARDCLEVLGTCVAPVGPFRTGRLCLSYVLTRANGAKEQGEARCGDLEVIPLAASEAARLELFPGRGFDAGAGPGKRWAADISGGPVGVVIDCRGRPLVWPVGDGERRKAARRWLAAVGACPEVPS